MNTNSLPLTEKERTEQEKNVAVMRATFEAISTDNENWLDKYSEWSREPCNQLCGILFNINPFNIENAGDRMAFDYSDRDCPLLVELIKMSFFLCYAFKEHEQKTVSKTYKEKNPKEKNRIISDYFKFVAECLKKPGINIAVILLDRESDRESVFYSSTRYFDSVVQFDALREIFRIETTEAIYLRFTQWRLTNDKKTFKQLLGQIDAYLKHYFYAYEEGNPELGLSKSIEGLPVNRKLEIISNWMKMIVIYTEGIFEEYRNRNWLNSSDQMMDQFHVPNRFSKFLLLDFKRCNQNDDNTTVQQKAICAISYIIWVKTADVITIFCDIFRILEKYPEQDLKRMGLTHEHVLNQFYYLRELRSNYLSFLLKHSAFYEAQRDIFNTQTMIAEEKGAQIIAASVDDVLELTSRVLDDDIIGLMQAKQKYLEKINTYLSEEQEQMVEEYMAQVAEKLKSKICKLDSFNALYSMISDDFLPYAKTLFRHPQILNSLVSAEFLYRQYIENQEEIQKFDYSCISILYYMALEEFTNKLIYIPYLNNVLIPEVNSVFNKSETGKYLTQLKYFKLNKSTKTLKDSCELGPLGYLLAAVESEEKLKTFLSTYYRGIDCTKISSFGNSLLGVKDHRNNAAHGGSIVTYQIAKSDKAHVYESKGINEVRGLIKELLEIIP